MGLRGGGHQGLATHGARDGEGELPAERSPCTPSAVPGDGAVPVAAPVPEQGGGAGEQGAEATHACAGLRSLPPPRPGRAHPERPRR